MQPATSGRRDRERVNARSLPSLRSSALALKVKLDDELLTPGAVITRRTGRPEGVVPNITSAAIACAAQIMRLVHPSYSRSSESIGADLVPARSISN